VSTESLSLQDLVVDDPSDEDDDGVLRALHDRKKQLTSALDHHPPSIKFDRLKTVVLFDTNCFVRFASAIQSLHPHILIGIPLIGTILYFTVFVSDGDSSCGRTTEPKIPHRHAPKVIFVGFIRTRYHSDADKDAGCVYCWE
jgi:hypothetical protein